jgi:hypothetical protein
MADKFEIMVRCAHCNAESALTAIGKERQQLLFDSEEDAILCTERLRKKPSRIAQKLGVDTSVETNGDTVCECSQCHSISRLRNLMVFAIRRL